MEAISKFIVERLEEVIKEDSGKLYYLTDFSPRILLEVYHLAKDSRYLSDNDWKIFLLGPSESENTFLAENLSHDYLREAFSPDHASKFRDTEKVLYIYPNEISEIISETINLNTALNLATLNISPSKCLYEHTSLIVGEKDWEAIIKNNFEKNIHLMIGETAPDPGNNVEFEAFYKAVLAGLTSNDISGAASAMRITCGLLPEKELDQLLSTNISLEEFRKTINFNIDTFLEVITSWNDNNVEFLEKLADFNPEKKDELTTFLAQQDVQSLIPYSKSVEKKRELINGWPDDLDVNFLNLRGSADFILDSFQLKGIYADFWGRYKIYSGDTEVRISVKKTSHDRADTSADVILRLNNKKKLLAQVTEDYEGKLKLSEFDNIKSFSALPTEYHSGSAVNRIVARISGEGIEADEEAEEFLFVADGENPGFFVEIEPGRVLAIDPDKWADEEIDLIVSAIEPISWKNLYKRKKVGINGKAQGKKETVGARIVIDIYEGRTIILNRLIEEEEHETETEKCKRVNNIFRAKLDYLKSTHGKALPAQNVKQFEVKALKDTFRLWLGRSKSRKYGPHSRSNPGKFGRWLEYIIEHREENDDLLPFGCLLRDENLVLLDPAETDWNEHERKLKSLKSFAPFIEARHDYLRKFRELLQEYGDTNQSCGFCDFNLMREQIITYSHLYRTLFKEALEETDYKFQNYLSLFFCIDAVFEFDRISNKKENIFRPSTDELGSSQVYIGPTHPIRALWCLKKSLYLEKVLERLARDNQNACSDDFESFIDGFGFPQYIQIPDDTSRLKPFVNISMNDGGGWSTYVSEDCVYEAMSASLDGDYSKSEFSLTSSEINYAINKYSRAHPFRNHIVINMPKAGKAGHLFEALRRQKKFSESAIKGFSVLFSSNYVLERNYFSLVSQKEREELPENLEITYIGETQPEKSHVLFSNTPSKYLTYGSHSFGKSIDSNDLIDGCVTWRFTSCKLESTAGTIDTSRIYFDKVGPSAAQEDKLLSNILDLLQRIILDPIENKKIGIEDVLQVRTQRVSISQDYLNKVKSEHEASHWVFSHNKDLDIEYFDLKDEPYVIDYDPGQSELVVTSKDKMGIIRKYIRRGIKISGIDSKNISDKIVEQIFDAINRYTGRSLIKLIAHYADLKGIVGLGLANLFYSKQNLLPPQKDTDNITDAAILISIDDYYGEWYKWYKPYKKTKKSASVKELHDIGDTRADLLWCRFIQREEGFDVNIEILEIKNRDDKFDPKWVKQITETYNMVSSIFALTDAESVSDTEIAHFKFSIMIDLHLRRHFRQVYQNNEDMIKKGEQFRVSLVSAICSGRYNILFEQRKDSKVIGKILHFSTQHTSNIITDHFPEKGYTVEYHPINTPDIFDIKEVKTAAGRKNGSSTNDAHGKPISTEKRPEIQEISSSENISKLSDEHVIDTEKGWEDPKIRKLLSTIPRLKTEDRASLNDELAKVERHVAEFLERHNIDVDFEPSQITPNSYRIVISGDYGLDPKRFEKLKDQFLLVKSLRLNRVDIIPGRLVLSFQRDIRGIVDYFECLDDRKITAGIGNAIILLGQDEATGYNIYWDLNKEAHALIGGATGMGKSQLLSVIIIDLALTNTPNDLELILIDPKRVEFSKFATLPHLQSDIIREQEEAIRILQSLESEMESRYRLMDNASVNNIVKYNNLKKSEISAKIRRKVIVFDEFADWMLDDDFKDQVTHTFQRLAGKARAAGIHLIIATQRPDNTVVPNILRANLTAKIALRVDKDQNSLIILGETGAEHLLGNGQMIAKFPGGTFVAQGAFINDEAIKTIVNGLNHIYQNNEM